MSVGRWLKENGSPVSSRSNLQEGRWIDIYILFFWSNPPLELCFYTKCIGLFLQHTLTQAQHLGIICGLLQWFANLKNPNFIDKEHKRYSTILGLLYDALNVFSWWKTWTAERSVKHLDSTTAKPRGCRGCSMLFNIVLLKCTRFSLERTLWR